MGKPKFPRMDMSDVYKGKYSFSVVKVDNVKITLKDIRVGEYSSYINLDDYNSIVNELNTWNITSGYTVELGKGKQTLATFYNPTFNKKKFEMLDIVYNSLQFQVKGVCETSNGFYYTTRGGISKAETRPIFSMPSDYDYTYYDINKLKNNANFYFSSKNHVSSVEQIFFNGNTVSLLFDFAFAFTCYDGTKRMLPTGEYQPHDILMPFSEKASDIQRTSFFPSEEPNFGLNYFSIFLIPNDKYGEPFVESYWISPSLKIIEDISENEPLDFSSVMIMTLAIDTKNKIFSMNSKIFRPPHVISPPLSEFSKDFILNNDGSYDFINGAPYRWDRKITNFFRIENNNYKTILEFSVTDGPDCGMLGTIKCGVKQTLYMKKAYRN